MLVLQGIALQLFYGSHLDVISRRLTGGVAGESPWSWSCCGASPARTHRGWIFREAAWRLDLAWPSSAARPHAAGRAPRQPRPLLPLEEDLDAALRERLRAALRRRLADRPAQRDHARAAARRRAARGGAAQAALHRHALPLRHLAGRRVAAALLRRRAVHEEPGARHPPAGRGRGSLRPGPRRPAPSSPKARPRCARPPPPSTACRRASAASSASGPRCWPASATTCAPRSPACGSAWRCCRGAGDRGGRRRPDAGHGGDGADGRRLPRPSPAARAPTGAAGRPGRPWCRRWRPRRGGPARRSRWRRPRRWRCRCAPDALRRCLGNLLDNARRHARRIAVAVEPCRGRPAGPGVDGGGRGGARGDGGGRSGRR